MTPLVSVLIPAFNSEKYIDETIKSVLNQTWKNIEVIVVDDGSTDGTFERASTYKSERLKVFKQENSGACRARNFAFEMSSGDIIQYLDADDILDPLKIEKQVRILEKYGNNVVAMSRLAKFEEDVSKANFIDQYTNKDYSQPISWLIDSWEGKGKGQTSVWICSRDLIARAGTWNETLKLNQDGEFFARVLLQATSIKYCAESVVYYRTGSYESISRSRNYQKALSLMDSYISYKRVLNQDNSPEVKHALMRNFLTFIYEYFPHYPDLLKVADQNIKELGFNNYSGVGGKLFQRFSNIFGFYNVLKMRSFIR